MAAERMVAVGLMIPWPAMAGAEVGDRAARHRARERERPERGEIALHADVEILQVLAHDDQVDALRARERAPVTGEPARRAHVGVRRLAPAEMEERRRAPAAGRAEEGRVRGVDGAAGGVVVLHRRTDPVDGEAEAVHERDRGAHRLGRGVLALDDDHALATAHRRLPAAGSLAVSTRSTLPPRIFSMSPGA